MCECESWIVTSMEPSRVELVAPSHGPESLAEHSEPLVAGKKRTTIDDDTLRHAERCWLF